MTETQIDPLAPTADELRQTLAAERDAVAQTARRLRLQISALERDLAAVVSRHTWIAEELAKLN